MRPARIDSLPVSCIGAAMNSSTNMGPVGVLPELPAKAVAALGCSTPPTDPTSSPTKRCTGCHELGNMLNPSQIIGAARVGQGWEAHRRRAKVPAADDHLSCLTRVGGAGAGGPGVSPPTSVLPFDAARFLDTKARLNNGHGHAWGEGARSTGWNSCQPGRLPPSDSPSQASGDAVADPLSLSPLAISSRLEA